MENGKRKWLDWINTLLLTVVLAGGGYVLKQVQDNAATLIRVEERQKRVLDTLPELQSSDRDLANRTTILEHRADNHEYRITDVEKKLNGNGNGVNKP